MKLGIILQLATLVFVAYSKPSNNGESIECWKAQCVKMTSKVNEIKNMDIWPL